MHPILRDWIPRLLVLAGVVAEASDRAAVLSARPIDPGSLLSMAWEGPDLRLGYTVSDARGTVRIYAAEQVTGLFQPQTLIFSGPVPPGRTGTLSLPGWASAASRFFALTYDPAVPNPDPDRLAWIAAGTFRMGSTPDEPERDIDESPQVAVTLTDGFFMGRHEVTQEEYTELMSTNPSRSAGSAARLPVEQVTWDEAGEYCQRLTERERTAGRLPAGWTYRLPSEAEWEYAARAGSTNRFSYGDDPGYVEFGRRAWSAANSGGSVHPVGQLPPNPWGLYDLEGNVAEWCLDFHGSYAGGHLSNPQGPQTGFWRVNRGGSWDGGGRYGRSAARGGDFPDERSPSVGFRVVLAPAIPVADFAGLDLVWIAPGVFTLGSPDREAGRDWDEGPQTEVTLTQGYWMGRYEVTQREYTRVMQANPSRFLGWPEQPVEQVSWADAMEFCTRITEWDRARGQLPAGYVYRLPTEAEWEYAARAGTTTRFGYGDDPDYSELPGYAWTLRDAGFITHLVGRRLANGWGLFDLHGNVAEWCWDWYGEYPGDRVSDPTGPGDGDDHVIRGGSFNEEGAYCRSAYRLIDWTSDRFYNVGFRVVLARPVGD